MKKTILALAAFTITTAAFAQTNRVDIGIEGGPTVATMFGNKVLTDYNNPRPLYTGGLFIRYNLPRFLSFQTGAYFERKGATGKVGMTNLVGEPIGTARVNTNFDYIVLPLLLRGTMGNNFRLFVEAGGYYGLLLDKSQWIRNRSDGGTDVESAYMGDFKNYDIGVVAGAGAEVLAGSNMSFSFTVRNNIGLVNISTLPIANDGTIQHFSTNFLFGMAYKLAPRK